MPAGARASRLVINGALRPGSGDARRAEKLASDRIGCAARIAARPG
jgi:hypothetical protein